MPPPTYACWTSWQCTPYGWQCPDPTPIVIDTRNEGFHLTDLEHGVTFKFLPIGRPIHISWTDGSFNNGFLALDRNGNGLVDDGTELFGNVTPQPPSNTPNGFAALAVFDLSFNGGNENAFIDEGDSVYSKLRVWIDKNHNGISEPGELHPLKDLGIVRIDFKYTTSRYVDSYGNEFRYRGRIWDDQQHNADSCYDILLQPSINRTSTLTDVDSEPLNFWVGENK